eukprot:4149190-Amphidinium_carterae.1
MGNITYNRTSVGNKIVQTPFIPQSNPDFLPILSVWKSPEIVRKTKSSVEREERFRAGGAHQRARAAAVQPK